MGLDNVLLEHSALANPLAFKRKIPKQLQLSFDDELDQIYYDDLPYHPYVTNNFLKDGIYRMRRDRAVSYSYIQHNPIHLARCLVFDIDKPFARTHWYDTNCPQPNYVIVNPQNGHCHYVYILTIPVALSEKARSKPRNYLLMIEKYLGKKLDADPNYVGLMSKNPLCDKWNIMPTLEDTYSLEELEEYLHIPKKNKTFTPKREASGFGRNCRLFDDLRWWAYARVIRAREETNLDSWIEILKNKAVAFNTFDLPLDERAARDTAKCVAVWTWYKYTGTGSNVKRGRDQSQNTQLCLLDKQVLSACKTNEQRKKDTVNRIEQAVKRLLDSKTKISIRKVANESGLSKRTIEIHKNILKSVPLRCTSDNPAL